MHTYISILRGINVSGQKLIKMDALKSMYINLGFQNVRTYVQSGNVVFESEQKDVTKIAETISQAIFKTFEFEVPVIVFDLKTLKNIINKNPYIKEASKDVAFLHVTFLASKPNNADEKSIIDKKHANEAITFTANAVYLYCPNGYGTTKLNNNLLESKLKVTATTRNWKTCLELIKLAET